MARAQYYGDNRMALPGQLLLPALRDPSSFNDFLEISLKGREAFAGIKIEFLGPTATSPGDGGLATAEVFLALEAVRKFGKVPHQSREAGAASVAQIQKLEG